MLTGFATPEGTDAYARRLAARAAPGHFRALDGRGASSLGIGTYLGGEEAATDAGYRDAVVAAVAGGVNVIDTAVNYRFQRSERAIGQALAALVGAGTVRREDVIVAISWSGESAERSANSAISSAVVPAISGTPRTPSTRNWKRYGGIFGTNGLSPI